MWRSVNSPRRNRRKRRFGKKRVVKRCFSASASNCQAKILSTVWQDDSNRIIIVEKPSGYTLKKNENGIPSVERTELNNTKLTDIFNITILVQFSLFFDRILMLFGKKLMILFVVIISFSQRNVERALRAYLPEKEITANINPPLFSWVLENVLKNAADAMAGKGSVNLSIYSKNKQITIDISDNGKGIPSSQIKTVFEPGYTTKERGWGLGLSLAKRIIEGQHKGKIQVKSSKINVGTTIEIILPLMDKAK